MNFVEKIEEDIRKRVSKIDERALVLMDIAKAIMKDDFSHGWPHVLRVTKIALKLAEEYEGIDLRALVTACILHDIGRSLEQASQEHHAVISSKFADKILRIIGYDDEFVEKVKSIILYHSYSLVKKQKVSINYIEAAILSDADKLDALGALGIARVLVYGAKINRTLEDSIKHIEEKILKLKDLIITPKAKEIALRRTRIVQDYIDEIRNELEELLAI